jgi:hypothetical protein
MEYFENGGGAVAKLAWSSARQPEQTIPSSQLRPPLPANQAPTVYIRAPSPGDSFLAPPMVVLTAEVDDINGDLAKVEFFADGLKLGETTDAPFRLPLIQPSAGDHRITVRASDQAGAFTATEVSITVRPLNLTVLPPSSGNLFVLRAAAQTGQSYRIEASLNLKDWTEVAVKVAEGGVVEFTEEFGLQSRFFRLVALP